MSKELELKAFLQEMKTLHDNGDKILDDFEKFLGDCVNSPVFEQSWNYSDLALRMAEKYFNDTTEAISWFIFDNEFGTNEMQCSDLTLDSIDTFVNYFFN